MQSFKLLAAVVACCAAAAQAQQQPAPALQHTAATTQAAARRIPAADRQFMARAAASGHAEVEAGRLAIAQAADPDVRSYGRMLVDDHQRADSRLVRIAHDHGINLPTGPSAQQRRELQRLHREQGDGFDAAFLQRMIVDHRQAVRLFQREAQHGHADVQAFARQVLPTLREHLRRAESMHAQLQASAGTTTARGSRQQAHGRSDVAQERSDARQMVQDSVQVVHRMKSDPRLAQLLQQARAVFIVPNYARGALGVGVQGGEGLLVTRQGQDFGSPAFYNMGGLSVGAQAGGAAGEVAFLLMTDRAVQKFRSDRKFSLDADAGLTIGNYSTRGQASAGKVQDVVVWSDTEGAYAGVSVGVTDVLADNEANRAYYGRSDATPLAILGGRLEDPYGNALGRVLGA